MVTFTYVAAVDVTADRTDKMFVLVCPSALHADDILDAGGFLDDYGRLNARSHSVDVMLVVIL